MAENFHKIYPPSNTTALVGIENNTKQMTNVLADRVIFTTGNKTQLFPGLVKQSGVVILKANKLNEHAIALGGNNVMFMPDLVAGGSRGYEIDAGESLTLDLKDLSLLYAQTQEQSQYGNPKVLHILILQ